MLRYTVFVCIALATIVTPQVCLGVASIHGKIGSETYVYVNAVGNDQGNGSTRTANVTGDYSIGNLPGNRWYIISDGLQKFYLAEGEDKEVNQAPGFPLSYDITYGPDCIKSKKAGQTFIPNAEYLEHIATTNAIDPVQITCRVYKDGPGGELVWDGGSRGTGNLNWWAVWVVNPPGSVKLIPGKRYYVEFTSDSYFMIPKHDTNPYRDGMTYVVNELSHQMGAMTNTDLTMNIGCQKPDLCQEYYSHPAVTAAWVGSVYQSYTAKGTSLRNVWFFLPWDFSQSYSRDNFIFSLHHYGGRANPIGAQIGPAKRASAGIDYSDGCGAVWDAGECPTVPGQQYIIKVTKTDGGFVAWYKTNDTSGNGDFFKDGQFVENATLVGKIVADAADQLPLNISNVSVTSLGTTGVRITWNTDVAAMSQVEYWTSASDHQHTLLDETLTTSHSVDLTRLLGNKTYYFRVKSYREGYVYAMTDGSHHFTTGCPGTIFGTVIDDTLQPVVGATITTSDGPFGSYSAITDNTGYYIIEHVEPGTYDITASRDGLQTTHLENQFVPSCGFAVCDFTMPSMGEYVANGGFEAENTLSPPNIVGWPLLTWSTQPPSVHCEPPTFFADIHPRSGSCFLAKAGNWTAGNGFVGQSVRVQPGKTYRLTAHYRIYWMGTHPSYTVMMVLAADPTGYAGSDGYSKAWLIRSPYLTWSQQGVASPWLPVTVECTAQTDRITAWLMYYQTTGEWRIACWDDVYISRVVNSLPLAKAEPNGTRVAVKNLVVTASKAQLGDKLYVESANRTSGIQVYLGQFDSTVVEGDVVTVEGKLVNRDGERALEDCVVTKTGTTTPLTTLGLTASKLGSIDAGLLVRTWGRVTSVGDGFFLLNDGAYPEGSGLSVLLPAGVNAPPLDSFVVVKGISGATMAGSNPIPVLRVRSASDITTMP